MRRLLLLLGLLAVAVPVFAQAPHTRAALTAAGTVSLDVSGMGTASITIGGTYTGAFVFEVVGDPGSTPASVDCFEPSDPGTAVNGTSSTGTWVCPVAGMTAIQARATTLSAGTAQVGLVAAPGGGSSGGGGAGGSLSGTVDVNVVGISDAAPLQGFTSGTLQSAATATGNGTTLTVNGYTGMVFTANITGTSATIILEGSADGSNWVPLDKAERVGAAGTLHGTGGFSTAGVTVWYAQVSAFQSVRARISACSSCNVTVTGNAVLGGSSRVVTVGSLKPDGTNTMPSGDAAARAIYTNQNFAGTAASTGNGTSDSGTQRVAIVSNNSAIAGMGVGATGSAVPASANYMAGVGSGSGGVLVGVPVCDQQAFLNMTSATTTRIISSSGLSVRICHIVINANGTTTATFKGGSGSDCATNTTALTPGYQLTAQVGFVAGTGVGSVLDGSTVVNTNDVCVTNSGSVNLQVFVRYMTY